MLCFHGPLIYEAKCLKSTITKDKQVKYFIHYAGWNKKSVAIVLFCVVFFVIVVVVTVGTNGCQNRVF